MKKTVFFSLIICFLTGSILSFNHLVLISAPGSGKGTLSQHVTEQHNYVQICPGDIFRSEIKNRTELGKLIEPVVERGDYVDEHIVCTLIIQNLEKAIKNKQCFILDGFPRSIISLNCLHDFFKKYELINNVIFLQLCAKDTTCIDRISKRMVCTTCFKVYNQAYAPPQQQNICDSCGTKLSLRKADTQEIVQKRLDYFHKNIEPLVETAQKTYFVMQIDSEKELSDLHDAYDQIIKKNMK